MEEFGNFLDIFIDHVCSRCSNTSYIHHRGLINNFLTPKVKIDEKWFDNYFKDSEHGFFHGLCACFISYVLQRRNDTELMFSSLLLHDFLKCNGYSQETHDVKLKNYYEKLLTETYTHSNPPLKDETAVLILCDRIELRRYSDYKEWVDKRYFDIFKKFDDKTNNIINVFYEEIRPILLKIYDNKGEIFLRHGLELIDKGNFDRESIYPRIGSHHTPDMFNGKNYKKGRLPNMKKKTNNKAFPIEIDRFPFDGFAGFETNNQNAYCSGHGLHNNWNKVKGFITLKDFTKEGGKIVNSEKRDHLYATSNIKLNKWIFLYQNVDDNNHQVKKLKESKIPIIRQKIVSKFFILVKLLQDRLVVLNNVN